MKKILLFAATAIVALSANAQDWNASSAGVLAKGATLLDNEFVTVVTGLQDTEASLIKDEAEANDPKTYAGFTFQRYVNIRVEEVPAEGNNFEGTVNNGLTPPGISLIVTAKKNTDMTLYYKHGDGKAVSCFDQTTKENVGIAETAVEGVASYYTGVYKFIKDHTYTIYAKGGTTGLNGISTAEGTYVEPTTKVYAYTGNTNSVTYGDGAIMTISSNTEKAYGKGASITIDGTAYDAIKNSNGAQNTFTAPTGKKIYRMTFYAIPNTDNTDPKFSEFNGTTLNIAVTNKKDGTAPTKTAICVNGAESVTFTYGGKQVNFIVEIDYNQSSYDVNLEAEKIAIVNAISTVKAAAQGSAIFNLAGQRVSAAVKGLFIKGGKKYIAK